MPVFDLHAHSNVSDGVLAPAILLRRAVDLGVDVLALTDHDTVGGLLEARRVAEETGLKLINGVEISVTWDNATVHIVGLRIDPENPVLAAGLHALREGRRERAALIAEQLARVGIGGALEGAYASAVNPDLIGRTHFARFLVDEGHVKNVKTVFKKYLVKGKPGYVRHQWASLGDAVSWIRAAGGQAVIAHPGRYEFGRERMARFFAEFRDHGGVGVEVATSSHTPEQVPVFARYANEYGLLASAGSDFHAPGEGGRELGRVMAIPPVCTPIWSVW